MEISAENFRDKAYQNRFVFPVIAIFVLVVGLRYYPARNMEFLQASDPYNLMRMSQQIAYEGSRPALDFMRWFPYATPSYITHVGNIAVPAFIYRLGGFLFFENYLSYAKFIIPVFAGLSSVGMYFLGKEVYDKYTGLAAAFFLAVIPGVMYRSSAGFFEKEPIGTMFMVFSLLFFTKAWKGTSWIYGILSGLALGLFTISWGGSQMLWLLYPMIIGFMLLIDQDIEKLLAAYTPTVLIAGAFGSIFNPGNFWFTDTLFLMALGFAALLWIRYLVEELELVSESRLPYFMPSIYGTGAVLMLLSPLYSQTLANIMFSIYSTATQSGSSVIGGTVAENASAQLNQIVTQLGSGVVDQIIPELGLITSTTGTWTLVFLAVPLMLTSTILMIGKRYGIIEQLSGRENYSLTAGIIAAWAIGFAVFFSGYRAIGIGLSLSLSVLAFLMVYYMDEEASFSISSMGLIFTAVLMTLFAFRGQNTAALLKGIAYPIWISSIGLGIIYYLEDFKPTEIELKWYKIIPLFWIVTNILGATARSRIIYLAAFPVALGAGYTFSKVLNRIRNLDLSAIEFKASNIRMIGIVLLVVSAISVNFVAGFAATQGISGSPNEAWMQSLDYLNEDAPNGSVTMSWWDYGYQFQSLGRTASVADGGNFGYYSDEEPINYPLAEYFTSTNTSDHQEFLEKHSVDYMVLDNTMIGKYQAVSQISRRDNSNYFAMSQAYTSGSLEDSVSEQGNRTVATFTRGPSGAPIIDQEPNDPTTFARGYAQIFVPFEQSDTSIDISEPATIRYSNGEEEEVNCVLTDEGVETFGDERTDYCIAEDPYYNFERSSQGTQARVVLVPETLVDHTINRLYFMDGHEIPYAEKVAEGSNDYIKMWEIE